MAQSTGRYRKAQSEERGREAQRLDKVLQDAGIELSSVATDILRASGRDMLDGLVQGTRNPEIPAKLDDLDEAIGRLGAEVDRLLAPFAAELALLDTIPGVDRRTAEALVAEMGLDMARFGSSARLASWAGLCPGLEESAGERRSGRTRKGPRWLGTGLAEAAEAAGRSKGTYLGARFRRLQGRLGPAKARKAVAHSILVAAFHVLDRVVPYQDLGPDWFAGRRPEAHARRLARQNEALG